MTGIWNLAARLWLIWACFAFGAGAASAAVQKSHYELVTLTLDQHVLPRVATLRAAGDALPASVRRVCEAGDGASRKDLNKKFRETVLAYAAVDYLRFGPLVVAGRRESLSFWPDPRGFVGRQLRTLIASNDAAAATQAAIAQQSAAIEGLPALEILVFDSEHPLGPGADAAYRCKLAEAIAQNIAALVDAVDEGWTKPGGWKEKMQRPGSDNDVYKDPQEAASELVKALLTGLSLVADAQIKPRLDEKALAVGPYAKSKLTSAYYEAGVASLHALYDTLDLESFLDDDKAWMRAWAKNAWLTMQSSDGFGGHSKAAQRYDSPKLRELFDKITGLRKLITREMSASAGLTVGFNELDGD